MTVVLRHTLALTDYPPNSSLCQAVSPESDWATISQETAVLYLLE